MFRVQLLINLASLYIFLRSVFILLTINTQLKYIGQKGYLLPNNSGGPFRENFEEFKLM